MELSHIECKVLINACAGGLWLNTNLSLAAAVFQPQVDEAALSIITASIAQWENSAFSLRTSQIFSQGLVRSLFAFLLTAAKLNKTEQGHRRL